MLVGTQVAGAPGMKPVIGWPGCDVVRAEVVSLGEDGPYQLTVFHARGTIVEYFSDTTSALRRQGEIEDLLAAARGASPDPLKRAV